MAANKAPDYLWKKDWKVKYKSELVVDIFDNMRDGAADRLSIEVMFQALEDMKYLIKMSDDIPVDYQEIMMAEVDELRGEFRPIADQYLEWLETREVKEE